MSPVLSRVSTGQGFGSIVSYKRAYLASQGGGGYQISRSLRFNSADTAYLNRTPSGAGNRNLWTLAFWIKRCKFGTAQDVFSVGTSGTDILYFDSSDRLCLDRPGATVLVTTQVFRDPSAWYHIALRIDSTNGTNANKAQLYVNGSEVTTFSTDNRSGLTSSSFLTNTAILHTFGIRSSNTSTNPCDIYLADIYMVDGSSLDPSSFTETSLLTGQLIPKTYSGSYGTNGFKLNFSSNASTAALGTDTSGNNNTWAVNNFSVANGTASYIGSTSGSLYSGSWINAFDGIIPSGFKTGAPYNYNTTSTLTFTSALSGTIEVYGANGGSGTGGTAYIALSDGSQWSVANITASNSQWYSFGSKTNITSISLVSDNLSQGVFLSGIRVNGVVLVDQSFNSGNDSLVDTPTSYGTDTGVGAEVRGNYCTINPLGTSSSTPTISDGNLQMTLGSFQAARLGTIGVTSGKWYWEIVYTAATAFDGMVGVARQAHSLSSYVGATSDSWGYYYNGNKYNAGTATGYGSSWGTGDVMGIALDMDNLALYFSKNGVWQNSGVPTSGASKTGAAYTNLSGEIFPALNAYGGTQVANFGQRAFAYTAPSGFKALVDTNLTAPAIVLSNTAFDTKLYTGNGSTNVITGLGFSPDFVWLKNRSDADGWHQFRDIVRGGDKNLASNSTIAESDASNKNLIFDSAGFTLTGTTGSADDNQNGDAYVAWAWDAGTSTVTNTAGSISSQVRANASAGFSVITYTGNGTLGATLGHSLGVAPSFFIIKRRSATNDWCVYHKDIGATKFLTLNSTASATTSVYAFNNTAPSSSVITIDGAGGEGFVNASGATYVCYAFSPVSGYSSFGSYTGNGSTDGPFVYLGFRPRWVMFKSSSSETDWVLEDAARSTYNVVDARLFPNASETELSNGNGSVDYCSNGFKLRNSHFSMNSSGATYLWAAFAENPFQYSRAR